MDIDAKLRPLFLLQILKERTDEDNYLTTTQLCDILKREYGLDTHRTTLKSDIEVLQRAGYSIDERRSTQNQYRFIEREFEVAELKTIIDAVASSKFIAEGKSNGFGNATFLACNNFHFIVLITIRRFLCRKQTEKGIITWIF